MYDNELLKKIYDRQLDQKQGPSDLRLSMEPTTPQSLPYLDMDLLD